MSLRRRLGALIPTRQQIHANRWLGWLGPWLSHPKLWHWSRRGVALGVALGVFFGLLVPITQIPLSVVAAVLLRANVPAAAASILVTNPLTFGPIYYGAYKLGAWVTGDDMAPEAGTGVIGPSISDDQNLWQRIAALGKPLLVGLSITAVLTGLTIYGLISLYWRWRILSKRRNR